MDLTKIVLKTPEKSSTVLEKDLSNCRENSEQYEKDLERIKQFRKYLMSESTEESLNKLDEDDLSFLGSQEQNDKETSAAVGTSKKSSSRNHNKNLSPIIYDEFRAKGKTKPDEEKCNEDLNSVSIHTESYEIDKLNMMETLAFLENDEDNELNQSQCSNSGTIQQAVLTILLTNRWQQKKKNKLKEPVRYQPTYRLEPKDDFNSIKYLIVKKIRNTFEILCEKHKYNYEYTPKFLRVITELIKNDAKCFKLDRYKIVAHVTILQKVLKQSVQFISRELFSIDDDHKLSFRFDMTSFHAVCLVFFVYHE